MRLVIRGYSPSGYAQLVQPREEEKKMCTFYGEDRKPIVIPAPNTTSKGKK